MEREPHIIRRQLLEFITDDTEGSYALQDEMALLYNELVLPMIDRCFSEISAQRHIPPIDLLELDLGTLDRGNLRYSFVQKAEAALRKKLAELHGHPPASASSFKGTSRETNPPDLPDSQAAFSTPLPEEKIPFHGKTIQFDIEEEEDADENEAMEDEATFPDPSSSEVKDAFARQSGSGEAASSEEKTPFHGKTIRFNIQENAGSHEMMEGEAVFPDPLSRDKAKDASARQSGSGESEPFGHAASSLQEETPYGSGENRETGSHSTIALIRFFLQTGLFPWWARETSRDAFERAVRECILAGKDLPQLVALLNRPDSLLRFTASLPDEVVRAVATAVSPMNEASLLSMQPVWEKLLPAGGLPARQHWWITVFSAAVARRLTHAKAYDPVETITAFLEPYPVQPTEAREKKYRNTYSKRLSLLEKFFSQNGFAAETARLRTAHELLSKKGTSAEEQGSDRWKAVHHSLMSGERISGAALTETRSSESSFRKAANVHHASLPHDSESSVGYGEKIYVENAGLVLLWPFLTQFFERLELTREHRFKHASAQEKALIALEILVHGPEHAPFFEASLPLNKVLCGVLPETPVNTDHTFRKAELKTIDGLLAAVMENSEFGKKLSAAGFREAWLQRKGALSVRDGHWLLQVERKTHDVLLDAKLPWGIGIVKLPWMDNLLSVEW